MNTFSILFKTAHSLRPLNKTIKADNIKEAIKKLTKSNKNIFVISYMQF